MDFRPVFAGFDAELQTLTSFLMKRNVPSLSPQLQQPSIKSALRDPGDGRMQSSTNGCRKGRNGKMFGSPETSANGRAVQTREPLRSPVTGERALALAHRSCERAWDGVSDDGFSDNGNTEQRPRWAHTRKQGATDGPLK